jgi:hypothetical protein
MSKLYKSLNLTNHSHKLVYDINKKNEELFGTYHEKCDMFKTFCRCKKIEEENEQSR